MSLPTSDPAPSRAAIVIFGAAVRPGGDASPTLRRRVEAACRFGATLFPPPLYVPTGGIGRHGPAEAVVMAALLRKLGVADTDILREETGTDTMSSALAVAALLRDWPGPVLAASSAYHLRRCVMLLRFAGLRARRAPPPPAHLQDEWYWHLREAAALTWDLLLVLIRRPQPFK